MFKRIGTIFCVLVLVALTILPASASAAGAPLRGQQITSPAWRAGATGECVCDIQWYTVKLRPGTVTVYGDLMRINTSLGPTYSLMVWMNRGNDLVGFAKNTCSRAKQLCNKALSITIKVPKAGVYYLKVKGLGGEGISYAIRVDSHIVPQKCGKSC